MTIISHLVYFFVFKQINKESMKRSEIMIYQNVFGKSPSARPDRLRSEAEDFDFTQTMLENTIMMEDTFFTIVRDHMMVTHLAMKDEDLDILQEGFSDIKEAAVKMFQDILQKFKDFMTKAFLYFNAYMGNFEKFLKKNDTLLRSIEPDFNLEGYVYTFSTDLPDLRKIEEVVTSYNFELSQIEKLTKAEVIKNRKEYLSTDALDNLRSQVIGSTRPIISGEYLDTVQKSYRNGSKSKEQIKVDNARLNQAIDDYPKLKQIKDDCDKQRENTIRIIGSITNFFKKMPSVHYKGSEDKVIYIHQLKTNPDGNAVQQDGRIDVAHSADKLEAVNLFFSYKFTEAKEMGSIAITAMTEKVSALKEQIKLTEEIIRKSLAYVKKKEGETK
jgi:hypothetical protein